MNKVLHDWIKCLLIKSWTFAMAEKSADSESHGSLQWLEKVLIQKVMDLCNGWILILLTECSKLWELIDLDFKLIRVRVFIIFRSSFPIFHYLHRSVVTGIEQIVHTYLFNNKFKKNPLSFKARFPSLEFKYVIHIISHNIPKSVDLYASSSRFRWVMSANRRKANSGLLVPTAV